MIGAPSIFKLTRRAAALFFLGVRAGHDGRGRHRLAVGAGEEIAVYKDACCFAQFGYVWRLRRLAHKTSKVFLITDLG